MSYIKGTYLESSDKENIDARFEVDDIREGLNEEKMNDYKKWV